MHLGLGVWGKFCGELLLTVRQAREEAEDGDGRRLGGEEERLRCSGLGRNRGWIQGFDSGDRSLSTCWVSGDCSRGWTGGVVGFRQGQQVGRQLRRSHRR